MSFTGFSRDNFNYYTVTNLREIGIFLTRVLQQLDHSMYMLMLYMYLLNFLFEAMFIY